VLGVPPCQTRQTLRQATRGHPSSLDSQLLPQAWRDSEYVTESIPAPDGRLHRAGLRSSVRRTMRHLERCHFAFDTRSRWDYATRIPTRPLSSVLAHCGQQGGSWARRRRAGHAAMPRDTCEVSGRTWPCERPGQICTIQHEPLSYETASVEHGIRSCWLVHVRLQAGLAVPRPLCYTFRRAPDVPSPHAGSPSPISPSHDLASMPYPNPRAGLGMQAVVAFGEIQW
jgi:hypothetical protein